MVKYIASFRALFGKEELVNKSYIVITVDLTTPEHHYNVHFPLIFTITYLFANVLVYYIYMNVKMKVLLKIRVKSQKQRDFFSVI